MGTGNDYDGIDDFTVFLVKHKARQLIGRVGFLERDLEDLEQELMTDLLDRLSTYRSSIRNHEAFVTKIIDHKVARIIELKGAGRRDPQMCTASLNETITDDGGEVAERGEVIDLEEYLYRTGKISRSMEDLQDLAFDVKNAIKKLPLRLRKLCKLLVEENPTEISRITGKARMTVYRHIKEIREAFDESGLRDYL